MQPAKDGHHMSRCESHTIMQYKTTSVKQCKKDADVRHRNCTKIIRTPSERDWAAGDEKSRDQKNHVLESRRDRIVNSLRCKETTRKYKEIHKEYKTKRVDFLCYILGACPGVILPKKLDGCICLNARLIVVCEDLRV